MKSANGGQKRSESSGFFLETKQRSFYARTDRIAKIDRKEYRESTENQ